jgi:hypothetical protein
MHGRLPQHDTSDQDGVNRESQRRTLWPLVMLALGGLLTAGWIGLLLWLASEAISGAFG